jgi:glycosyltransferase involved in cell wall biosynthesis
MASVVYRNLIVHASSVHLGGGLNQLLEFFSANNLPLKKAFLDKRAKCYLQDYVAEYAHYVKPTVFSRLLAELCLWRDIGADDTVLCFHGLPPLLPLSGRAVVFVQNRILIEQVSLVEYPLQTQLRLLIERFWFRALKRHATRYVVQTPSMAASLKKLLGNKFEIRIVPFASSNSHLSTNNAINGAYKFDFLYVASGDAHKNHVTLLEAWRLLAEAGFKPSLALTVDPIRYPKIHTEISKVANDYLLNIVNLGQLPADEVTDLYQSSSALIYPSKTESFGLPLIEAAQHKLPILASELDYVRDVVVPIETFDPSSPVSIARAVRRFLGNAEPTVHIHSAQEFLAEVLS